MNQSINVENDDFEPLVQAGHPICSAELLVDGGDGFRFQVRASDIADRVGGIDHRIDETLPAFLIRYDGVVYAYLNRCAHVAMELDWQPGQFFTQDQTALICASHDAQYLPDTGECISGPCPQGATLIQLHVEEKEGQIFLCQAV